MLPSLESHAGAKSLRTDFGHGDQLWFELDVEGALFSPYSYELAADGALWLEAENESLECYETAEWEVEYSQNVARLWLLDSDDSWSAYNFLTQSQAEVQLEAIA
jgi:hypothetical protein